MYKHKEPRQSYDKTDLGFEWPLAGGGVFKACITGRWTKADIESLREFTKMLVDTAAVAAVDEPPSARTTG